MVQTSKEALLEEMKQNAAAYHLLIEKRIEELTLPEDQKTLKTNDFVKQEKIINEKSRILKEKLGISARTEAMLCNECNEIYSFKYKKNKVVQARELYHCKNHKDLVRV